MYFLLVISTGMRLSCSKQLVNPFLMMMMIHLSRLLGVFLLAEFLIRIYESLSHSSNCTICFMLTIIYFWLYHFDDAGCCTSGVCYVFVFTCFYVFGSYTCDVSTQKKFSVFLSFGLIQFIAHVARFRSFVALFAATSSWPEKYFVSAWGSYCMADVICEIPAFNFVWIQVGK